MMSSKSTSRRWVLYRDADVIDEDGSRWVYQTGATPPLAPGDEVEVMPVSEHEELREAAQAVLDAHKLYVREYKRQDALDTLRLVLKVTEGEHR